MHETDDLKQRFDAESLPDDQIKPTWNAAPGQLLPVVSQRSSGRSVDLMKWGLIPVWAKERSIGYRMFNARAESVFDKPTWKGPVLHHRCIVPINGFYEWQKTDDGKQPFYIYDPKQSILGLAGVSSQWTDKTTGEVIESFSIVTTEPNKEMRPIHDRMPVIIDPEDEAKWLDPKVDTADKIDPYLHPYHDGGLKMHPVDAAVGNARNNDASLIVAVQAKVVRNLASKAIFRPSGQLLGDQVCTNTPEGATPFLGPLGGLQLKNSHITPVRVVQLRDMHLLS